MKLLLTLAGGVVIIALALFVSLAASAGPQGRVSSAALRGDLPAIREYLAGRGDPNLPDGPRGTRPLAAAARASQLDVMQALVEAGADVNLPDAAGNRWVPLIHAVHKHQPRAVRLLLARGALADGPTGLSLTPLMMAVASGQTEVARMLLDAGANPRKNAPDGASLLALAVSGGALTDIDEPLLGGCHPETVQLLLHRAPDLSLGSSIRGRLARLFARLNGCHAVLAIVGGRS
jgi:uncharacterized protein